MHPLAAARQVGNVFLASEVFHPALVTAGTYAGIDMTQPAEGCLLQNWYLL
jgi:hypothetical protein